MAAKAAAAAALSALSAANVATALDTPARATASALAELEASADAIVETGTTKPAELVVPVMTAVSAVPLASVVTTVVVTTGSQENMAAGNRAEDEVVADGPGELIAMLDD